MKEISVEVITPSSAAYTGAAGSVTIPGTSGGFQVLYNHAPLMSTFDVGIVKVEETSGDTKIFATGGGTVEVRNNKVLLLAESFEAPEKIDAERAEEAKDRALERLAHRSKPDIDEVRAEFALKRAINRLKVINL
ncbi:MAG: ATP synthase epsilon chain [Melioribacteraceae bacterium]|nr:MAG: ATP synthase epsilon chain [Melioribacteraceae bacterium]